MPNPIPGPSAAPAPTHGGALLEQRVEDAQAALMFEQSWLSNIVGVPFAGLVCWLLWNTVDHAELAAWLGLKTAVTVIRIAAHWRWRQCTGSAARRWAHAYTALLVVDGAVYGLIGTWLLPQDDPAMAAMMLASVVGVASVGFVVLSANLRASAALLLPLLGPNILWQLGQGTRLGTYTALAFLLFVGLIVYEGRRASAYSRAMHKLRFQMDDLAEQREQALRLAERHSSVKSRFLATMSHEMRTPLNGLLGMLQVLRREVHDGGNVRAAYELMERSGTHLLRIINDVLDLSKIEAGRIELEIEPFDLSAVIGDVGRIFRALCEQKGVELAVRSELDASHWVLGDGVRVRQVLDNLLGNACKFTLAGRVTLHVHRDGERVIFRVEDSGIGIAPQELPRLFSPFHQADSSYARRHGGTGLGLAISQRLAREMHGDVRCERTGAQGSEFVFEAVLRPSAAPPAVPKPQAAGPMCGRVLLVEDNAVNVIVATALLEQLGLQVESVGDGEAAIMRCHEHPPDIVLMDCQMPSVDGFEATRRIRHAEARSGRARLPIIALTANALPGDRARCLAAGMDDHLPKPVQLEELRQVLKRWLR